MTKQKKCEHCIHWGKVADTAVGPISEGGEFREPEQKSGFCGKHNEVKSAHDTCDDWEPKK